MFPLSKSRQALLEAKAIFYLASHIGLENTIGGPIPPHLQGWVHIPIFWSPSFFPLSIDNPKSLSQVRMVRSANCSTLRCPQSVNVYVLRRIHLPFNTDLRHFHWIQFGHNIEDIFIPPSYSRESHRIR